ncbi:40S ribosomal protein S4, partial [Ascosphaera pollenicola]
AQLLSDVLYYHPNNEIQPWLIYYISKPLLGTYEPARIVPAVVPTATPSFTPPPPPPPTEHHDLQLDHMAGAFAKKKIKTFGDLLANFPMIARQMEPGLNRLFTEFEKELGGKPLPPRPSETPATSAISETNSTPQPSETQATSNATSETASTPQPDDPESTSTPLPEHLPFNSSEYFEDDEDLMRRTLETAVTSAIDLFRLVDKQQLSLLGATTDLTGPLVERLIERHIAQQVHSTLLFPRLCACHRTADLELDAHIRQMEHLDVSQVGIAIEDGRQGKRDLLLN